MINFPATLAYTQKLTPIIPLVRDDQFRIWMKRDDLTGMELSGNKIRKLDFLVREALDQKADTIMTCGGLQSNHCRAAAYLAAKVGLETILFLRGEEDKNPTGNYFLNILSGAKINYVSSEQYLHVDQIMTSTAEDYKREKKKVYIIPEGGSNVLGAWGYCQCFFELIDQIEDQKLPIEAVVVATGSGGTHAGLLIGKYLKKSSVHIFSINVCDNARFFKNKIASIVRSFEQKYNYNFGCKADDVIVFDGFVGKGYAEVTKREIDFIQSFATKYGIILDPVYTAKAFIGLESLIEQKKIDYHNILFIHTGGIFGIFPFAKKFI